MFLTQEQVRFFRHNGYLKLPYTLPVSMVEQLKGAIDNALRERIHPYSTDEFGRIIKLSSLAARAPVFMEVITSALILDPLESLLGPNIELTLNRHNHATLTLKGAAPPRLHRDILQWSRSLVSTIIYLEESTVENGCTRIIPGSHFLPFVGTPNNGGTWMDEHSVYADLLNQALPIPMPRGGVLIFDSLAFHSAGVNTTEGTRLSLTLAYHSVDELTGAQYDSTRLLVRGERLYRGNDLF
ncbi:MAG TPA: phytanoyl-CoA dioxygenase family protein [Pyrinomonadaceae bacterium]|nr:phytanoyl-CoA dioxygenase family protein [Pyrinomonadaceae bacterium]